MRTFLFLALGWMTVAAQTIDRTKLVDLTYNFNEKTVYWPNAEGFRWHPDVWAVTPGGYWYAAGHFSAAEHGGTHLDSPVHFSKGQASVDQIPVSRLVAPVEVLDVRAAAARNPDYRVAPADILAWEKQHGVIPARTIVLFHTGWGKFWPERKTYLGCDTPGDITCLHFPGLSKEAAELLVKRQVDGVGLDTASLDYGPSKDFIVHQVLNAAGIFGLENVAHLERLPARGATLLALPIKIEKGTGGPARIVALLP